MFQSTLPTRGSDNSSFSFSISHVVSIHAPHEGERPYKIGSKLAHANSFNPRSPRGGATMLSFGTVYLANGFQSTLPTRGSDQFELSAALATGQFQSTLPTRGSDHVDYKNYTFHQSFNPRSPRGGATISFEDAVNDDLAVSIHAPHEGERRLLIRHFNLLFVFQSTLPTRGSDH